MYVDICRYKQKGKIRVRALLRTSFRQNGKVKHETFGNLSSCSPQEIEAIRFALQHKNDLARLKALASLPVTTQQGLSVGAVFVLQEVAKRLGIQKALGRSREALLSLWLVMARLIDQGSRLSAVRLATRHAACDLIGMDSFNEDDLYDTLTWLSDRQPTIEDRLFRYPKKERSFPLFLYDVTSSYFEGPQNELADYGYNRDGKKGKKQIVIGLLTDEEGDPISVQVYKGNTSDSQTFLDQVQKVKDRFGVKAVTMVGDRGMIKSGQIECLPEGFHYLTALTKPQIKTLLKKNILQMELFDEDVGEVEWAGIRYVLRRNPVRKEEIARSRADKQQVIQRLLEKQNEYLSTHSRAWVSKALATVQTKIERLKLEKWFRVEAKDRVLSFQVDRQVLQEISLLDGCYVIKTDTPKEGAPAQVIHDRYKDLAQVEMAFRTMKTAYLETRPHFVRKEKRTRGHVFVAMLAYKMVRYLKDAWKSLDITVEEGVHELASICATEVKIGDVGYQTVPQPRPMGKALLKAIDATLPEAIPSRNIEVATRKKLTPRK